MDFTGRLFLCLIFSTGTLALSGELVGPKGLKRVWGNGAQSDNGDGSVRVTSKSADGPSALNGVTGLSVIPGAEYTFRFQARGDVKLQVMLNFPDSDAKRADPVMPTQLSPDAWKSFQHTFTMPKGSEKVTLDIFAWKQVGYFDIKEFSFSGPPAVPQVLLMDEFFRRGEYVQNRFSATIPAGWSAWRGDGAPPDAPVGGLSKDFPVVNPQFHSLPIPAAAVGAVGWIGKPNPLPPGDPRPLVLQLRYRRTADYANNIPRVIVDWLDAKGTVVGKETIESPVAAADTWLLHSVKLNPGRRPANAAAFRMSILTAKSGDGAAAGRLYYGQIRIFTPTTPGAFAKIRGGAFANWFTPGSPVVFRAEGPLPPVATGIVGHVYRDGDALLDTVATTPADFADAEKGWRWTPPGPGLYQVAFAAVTPDGELPLVDEYHDRAMNNQIALFARPRHDFAVVPDRADGTPVPKLFGYQIGVDKNRMRSLGDQEVRLAKLAGGEFGRFHVTWFDIEPEKGRFDWDALDYYVEACEKLGIRPVVCFYGTPRWASNTPDDDRMVVHVWAYNAYAPKDIGDWENFLATMVRRYKDRVDTWEVWNEPHLRDYSCYWHDTPENYVKLLESAYKVIKGIQPDSKIWLGGIALRYQPFYERIIELGAGKYFDYFAMHGHGQSIKPFYAIDQRFNSPTHPWVASEWHASLIRFSDPAYKLNENQRTVRLMTDFFRMIRENVKEVAFFEPFNLVEKESLELHHKGGAPLNHTSGVFRRRPYFQPVLGGVVMQNFSRGFMGDISLTGLYRHGEQKVAAFKSDYGTRLVFWHSGDNPEPLAPALAAVLAGASVESWEGRPLGDPAKALLAPSTMYFAANVKIPADWKQDERLLEPERVKAPLEHKTAGVYGDKPLFDGKGKLVPANVAWNAGGFAQHVFPGFPTPLDKPTRFAVAFTADKFQLVVETKDRQFFQPAADGNQWQGDGVEFAIDAFAEGVAAERLEFMASKGTKGEQLFKVNNPTLVGDLPTDWTPAGQTVRHGFVKVEFLPNETTRYLIEMKRSELYPFIPKKGQTVRFSLLVNESDGKNRVGLVNWARGIFNAKNPGEYGDLKLR